MEENLNYLKAWKTMNGFKVVNDTAEKGNK